MKPILRIFLFILIAVFGFAAFRKTLGPQKSGLFLAIQYIPLAVVFILAIIAIGCDVKAYRQRPGLFQFYSSATAIFLGAIVLHRLISFSAIENSKTIFIATSPNTVKPFFQIHFKQNGGLRIRDIQSQVPFIYYGRYFQNKDTLTITQTNYDAYFNTLPISGILTHNKLLWPSGDTMTVKFPQALLSK